MTPLPVSIESEQAEPKQRVQAARLRLVDVVSDLDLRPLASPEQLEERLVAAMRALEDIVRELQLIRHVTALDEAGIEAELTRLDKALAKGWKPEAVPVDELVSSLKAKYGL